MENKAEFVSYKKVLIFGEKSSGKTSLTKLLISKEFTEVESSKDSI